VLIPSLRRYSKPKKDGEKGRETLTKLLIVDDEPFTVDMLSTFLQINGYEAVGALNGEDGLVLVKVEQPELVILDLMLPDIEGYEVCERIRAYPASAGLPVLIMSARADANSKERAVAAGANGYLVKPVKFPELLSELTRLLTLTREAAARALDVPKPAADSPASTPASTSDNPVKQDSIGGTPDAPKPPASTTTNGAITSTPGSTPLV
jgi:DNA-binding response OmpR family regulator